MLRDYIDQKFDVKYFKKHLKLLLMGYDVAKLTATGSGMQLKNLQLIDPQSNPKLEQFRWGHQFICINLYVSHTIERKEENQIVDIKENGELTDSGIHIQFDGIIGM